jgi:predicted amidohydrolase
MARTPARKAGVLVVAAGRHVTGLSLSLPTAPTISSDVHALSVKGPAFDQLVTMSKFLCLGMELIVFDAPTGA